PAGAGGNGLGGGGNGTAGMGGTLYNTITTPRGGQYQITLPDQTKVWLNAESSLRFPTAFAGKDRAVQLTGEAYFEVAADKSKPFLVKAGSTETRVLGTHFNIMAYSDEGPVKTTLLEGAVSMGQEMQSALLQPGEQGQFDSNKGIIATRAVNTRAVVAWKDGYYYFDRASMQSVMRQISRWYDVEIVYEGAVPKDEIVGKMPRTAEVSEVLHIMELIGIRFKIEGKKITVLG
ncbi:MAG TPA: FecR domain-containing protein, partial [Puia sp.]|nr:FecR domain-containing protein [Puia sp.]